MRRTTIAAAAFALATCWGNAGAAPIFNPATGHYYELVTGNWFQAEAASVALGGHLVTLNNAAEEQWIIDNFGGFPNYFWIGFSDYVSEGNFVWSSGEAVTYTNWNVGEPNNLGGVEDFAYMNWTGNGPGNGDWNDVAFNNSGVTQGIAEFVPEPPVALLLGVGLVAVGAARRRR